MTRAEKNHLMARLFPLALSASLHVLVITAYCLLVKSVYALTEDFYVAYLTAGGFSDDATHLVHYNHGIHPFLTWPVYRLFLLNDGINWYSLLLVSAHAFAGTIIFYCVLKKSKHWFFIASYWLLFFVFEGDNLLHVNFNNTALVLYTAALVWLFTHLYQPVVSGKSLVIAAFLFAVASLFRMHVGLVITGVALPFLGALLTRKLILPMVVTLVSILLIVGGLHVWQEKHYEKHITGWKQEEIRRQQVYQLYNTALYLDDEGTDVAWNVEYHLAKKGLLVDTFTLHSAKLEKMLLELKHNNKKGIGEKWKQQAGNKSANYWFWTNNRLFLFTTLFLILLLPLSKRFKLALAASGALLLGGILYLMLFARLMDYVLPASLHTILLLALVAASQPAMLSAARKTLTGFGFFIILLWTLLHIGRSGSRNEALINQFKTCYNKIVSEPGKLFIITSYDFPLQQFYIWDLPRHYPLKNFISNEHFLLNRQQPVLKHFGVNDFKEIIYRDNILFWGNEAGYIKAYLERVTGNLVILSSPKENYPSGATVVTVQAIPR